MITSSTDSCRCGTVAPPQLPTAAEVRRRQVGHVTGDHGLQLRHRVGHGRALGRRQLDPLRPADLDLVAGRRRRLHDHQDGRLRLVRVAVGGGERDRVHAGAQGGGAERRAGADLSVDVGGPDERRRPVSGPSSASVAEPVNVTEVPANTVAGAPLACVGRGRDRHARRAGDREVDRVGAESALASPSRSGRSRGVPPDSVLVEKFVPVPIGPSRSDVHTSAAPVEVPSSGSVALPANVTDWPLVADPPSAGCVIVTTGFSFGTSFTVRLRVACRRVPRRPSPSA